ncbi:MAG: DUF1957 domain-containing protein [Candidatus Omnitrophica bacterium]|nr:DUF1957 domain-containing protein [Candidatus Omnitrophota bacterium]
MSSPEGYLCLVLHGHLPFVRNSEVPECLEEDWFFEAVTEVYLPLLDMFSRLQREGIRFRISFNLSPTLTAMFADPLMTRRYEAHLENLIRLAESECARTAGSADFAPLAGMCRDRLLWVRDLWGNRFRRDLIGAFRALKESGQVELLTTAATHGFLPLMEVCPAALRAQVEVGIESFRRFFGSAPSGFWLPECGYTPLVGEVLRQAGIRYTFLETHGILHAVPRPRFGVYAPVRSPQGLFLFGRDPETAHQVWSAVEGYPGDPVYRDFYRDIGFDLPEEYLRPFRNHGGLRVQTGIKYHRITGRTGDKEPYRPDQAQAKAQEHAGNFLFNRQRQVEHLSGLMGQPPVVTAMYDAELFGHWWFEGPLWLEAVIRRFHDYGGGLRLATPPEVLSLLPRIQPVSPHLSTWGWKGYNEMWLQGANAWIYRHLHQAAWAAGRLAAAEPGATGLRRRAFTQALRELLLAQASDWAFILAQGTSVGYAQSRLSRHLARFNRLIGRIQHRRLDEAWLADLEAQDNLFPFLDEYRYR